jgi:predicted RNA-binding protein with TRAM domain
LDRSKSGASGEERNRRVIPSGCRPSGRNPVIIYPAPTTVKPMKLPAALCLFTGRVEQRDGEYVLTVPQQEIDLGAVEASGTYRVGLYPGVSAPAGDAGEDRLTAPEGGDGSVATGDGAPGPAGTGERAPDQPPVSEGETLELQIEDVGDQGDGLARVGPGYVVFVPDTEVGQQPLVRITAVRENFAFAEVVER